MQGGGGSRDRVWVVREAELRHNTAESLEACYVARCMRELHALKLEVAQLRTVGTNAGTSKEELQTLPCQI
jgi:hypothetical protein